MKKILLLITITLSMNVLSIEYNSKVICKNGECERKDVFSGIRGPELKIENLEVGQCLLDIVSKKFFRVENVEKPSKKIVLISEIEDESVIVVMKRDTIYSDSKAFNVNLKILPCTDVNGRIINNEVNFNNCIAINGKRVLKLFCEKDRKKNF